MARVTLVVNHVDEGSETFLHSMAAGFVAGGHDVTVHALLAGRTAMAGDRTLDAVPGVRTSGALPAARSARVVPAAGRLVRRDPAAVGAATRRAVAAFGAGGRAARAAALAAPILATRPRVVHLAFSGIAATLADAVELLDPGTALVVSCRGTGELVAPVLDPTLAGPLGRVLRRADAVHAVADVVARAAVELGARPERVRVIRPAVDLDLVRRTGARPGRRGPLQVLSVSRLHWIKAVDVQLSAAAELRRQGLDLRWTVAGDGPERPALRFRARALGLDDRVRLLGAVPHDEVRSLLSSADCFVLSSLSEGTSNSVLEAMAMEVPVVSTGAGGMAEVLSDGVDALLVPPGDAGALAAAVARVASDPALASSLATAGRRTVTRVCSLAAQQQAWRGLLAEVLGSTDGVGDR